MNGTIECAFIGRLGQDPDLRTAASGKPWMRLSLAVARADTTQWVGDSICAILEQLDAESDPEDTTVH